VEVEGDPRCHSSNLNGTLVFTKDFNCDQYLDYIEQTKEIENKLYEYWIIIASVYIILM